MPRLASAARQQNLALVDLIRGLAVKKRGTPAQIALAWLLARKPWIVPIPGTTRPQRLQETLGAMGIELDAGDLAEIDTAAASITLTGERLPAAALAMTGL